MGTFCGQRLDNRAGWPHHPLVMESDSNWVFFAGGGVALYIAARSAADALVGGRSLRAGRLAIGNWMPICVVALAALLLNQTTAAVGVIFATSIASLTLGVGTIFILAESASSAPSAVLRSCWAMILPAALLVFLAGFRGELTILHAGVLAAEGIVVLILWNDRRVETAVLPVLKYRWLRGIQFVLAVALAGIGGWAACNGMERASHANEAASPGLLAATFLSPLLLLPLLGAGVDLVHRGQAETAASACVGLTLLNMCALAPILIIFSYVRGFVAEHFHTARPFIQRVLVDGGPVQLPLVVWRVDVMSLTIVLGLFLLPVGLGRWKLSRTAGMGLIGGYAA